MTLPVRQYEQATPLSDNTIAYLQTNNQEIKTNRFVLVLQLPCSGVRHSSKRSFANSHFTDSRQIKINKTMIFE